MADLDDINNKCSELRNTPPSIIPPQCVLLYRAAIAACDRTDELTKDRADKLADYTAKLDAYNAVKVDEDAVQAQLDQLKQDKEINIKLQNDWSKKLALLQSLLNNESSSGQSYNGTTPLSQSSIDQLKKQIKDINAQLSQVKENLADENAKIPELEKKLQASKDAKKHLDNARISLETAESLLDQGVTAALKAYNDYKQCKANDTANFVNSLPGNSNSSNISTDNSTGTSSSSSTGSSSTGSSTGSSSTGSNSTTDSSSTGSTGGGGSSSSSSSSS